MKISKNKFPFRLPDNTHFYYKRKLREIAIDENDEKNLLSYVLQKSPLNNNKIKPIVHQNLRYGLKISKKACKVLSNLPPKTQKNSSSPKLSRLRDNDLAHDEKRYKSILSKPWKKLDRLSIISSPKSISISPIPQSRSLTPDFKYISGTPKTLFQRNFRRLRREGKESAKVYVDESVDADNDDIPSKNHHQGKSSVFEIDKIYNEYETNGQIS
ncbi:unnamed protein product [Blepharisma stoltei]|uniref:Uncharacterized protein n=1 Tax=Blepharisma stoltei TaxID=1481888 RepID=A0AAU9IZC0_9CILI|nr:unnamed protein product [Blepharisma stoltei]